MWMTSTTASEVMIAFTGPDGQCEPADSRSAVVRESSAYCTRSLAGVIVAPWFASTHTPPPLSTRPGRRNYIGTASSSTHRPTRSSGWLSLLGLSLLVLGLLAGHSCSSPTLVGTDLLCGRCGEHLGLGERRAQTQARLSPPASTPAPDGHAGTYLACTLYRTGYRRIQAEHHHWSGPACLRQCRGIRRQCHRGRHRGW